MPRRLPAFLRGTLIVLLVAVALASVSLAVLYFGSTLRLRQLPAVPSVMVVPPYGDAAEGARLASILGCRGCHGEDLGGRADCFSVPGELRLTCPNVTEARSRYDDEALVALLRHGRKLDGALVDFMPWDMYHHLNDADLGHLLAYLRSAPPVRNELPASNYSWRVRWQMIRGDYPWQNDLRDYDTTPRRGPAERGRYLAAINCPECHAPNLRGYEGDDAPNLVVAKAYSVEAFVRLMRTGTTLAGTESRTGMMSQVARSRYSHLTDEELLALKAYLDERLP